MKLTERCSLVGITLLKLLLYNVWATLTATRHKSDNDVITINEKNQKYNTVLSQKSSMGISYDIRTGKFWSVVGMSINKQKLKEFCYGSIIEVSRIKPNDVQLTCLTSGISGVYAIEMADFDFGKLNTETGVFNSKGLLPAVTDTSFSSYVFAQDNDGVLHYINGDGEYYTNKKNDKKFERVKSVSFSGIEAFCGDFVDDNTIVAVGVQGDVVEISISKGTFKSKVLQTDSLLLDVTNGPLSKVCPASTLTAMANSNQMSIIVDIYSSSYTNNYELERTVGITKDSSTGYVYAISKSNKGRQVLNQLCKSAYIAIADISPSNVELTCLTSGKRGIFAIDLKSKTFGKLNIDTGNFESKGSISGPYDKYAFAQDYDGVLHYINGKGKHYKTGENNNDLQASGIQFPASSLGTCGEFDGSDIITASTSKKGGTIRYSFLKSNTFTKDDNNGRVYTDITTGSITTDDKICLLQTANPTNKPTANAKKASKMTIGPSKAKKNSSDSNKQGKKTSSASAGMQVF